MRENKTGTYNTLCTAVSGFSIHPLYHFAVGLCGCWSTASYAEGREIPWTGVQFLQRRTQKQKNA